MKDLKKAIDKYFERNFTFPYLIILSEDFYYELITLCSYDILRSEKSNMLFGIPVTIDYELNKGFKLK